MKVQFHHRRCAQVIIALGALLLSAKVCVCAPQVYARLESTKQEYVLGEPVVVTVTLHNPTDKPYNAWVDSLKWQQIRIEISGDGQTFKHFVRGRESVYAIVPATWPVDAKDSKRYEFRLFYTHHFSDVWAHSRKLAFDSPGRYLIRAEYHPFPQDDATTKRPIKMNTITIEVNEPKAVDARLWPKLNTPQMLYFMQRGELLDEDDDLPYQVIELLKTIADSSYHDDLKSALKQYFIRRYSSGELDENNVKLFRQVLGIKEPEPQPFPEDQRLDQMVTYRLSGPMEFESLFALVSEQTQINLQLHHDLKRRSQVGNGRVTISLRDFMRRTGHKAKWVPDGDGYRLEPVESTKPKQSQPAATDATDRDADDLNHTER